MRRSSLEGRASAQVDAAPTRPFSPAVRCSTGRLQAIIAALASTLCVGASACSYDLGFAGNPFALPHPRSLELAAAVYDAARMGRIDLDAAGPELNGAAGLQRAGWRLRQMARSLGGNEVGEAAISLVLVDISLWVRLTPAPLGAQLQMHVAGPAPGDVVAVSSEVVVAQLAAGRLSGEDALRQGLLLLEGDPADVKRAAVRIAGIGAPR
jgi:hypothetical protein